MIALIDKSDNLSELEIKEINELIFKSNITSSEIERRSYLYDKHLFGK